MTFVFVCLFFNDKECSKSTNIHSVIAHFYLFDLFKGALWNFWFMLAKQREALRGGTRERAWSHKSFQRNAHSSSINQLKHRQACIGHYSKTGKVSFFISNYNPLTYGQNCYQLLQRACLLFIMRFQMQSKKDKGVLKFMSIIWCNLTSLYLRP